MSKPRAGLDKKSRDISTMFNSLADRYDLMNDILSLGAVRFWHREVVTALNPKTGMHILDLAAGTGASSLPLAEAGAVTYPTDLSFDMLHTGAARTSELNFINGDGSRLPFADQVFDAVTISFGLRNVENVPAVLAEMRRVTKPGGSLVICEFSTPSLPWFRTVYHSYLRGTLPVLSRLSSNNLAYDFLVESILNWYPQQQLAQLMAEAGWSQLKWRNLTGGIVCIHKGKA